jgi:hypothetical protein
MNPRIRLYTFAAAGLVVALVGLYLFGRMSPPVDVGASPSPVATPTAQARTAMPAALQGIWIGGPRALVGLDEDAGRVLTFEPGGAFSVRQSANGGGNRVISTVAGVGPDRVVFTSVAADSDCDEGAEGAYTWAVSSDGQTLTLAEVGPDVCAVRASAVTGSWELSDCPTPEDNCLGTIAAGTHASQFFDHLVGPGDVWTPRYGAFTYTVPDGWVNVEDWPQFYTLAPAGGDGTTVIHLRTDVVLSSRADHCSDSQDPEAGSSAEEIATALAVPGLDVSSTEAVTIGGLPGFRLDVALDPTATPCPFSEGRPHHELFADRDVAPCVSWGIGGESHQRLYLLEVEPGRVILVAIDAPTDSGYLGFVGEATAVVESLVFTP